MLDDFLIRAALAGVGVALAAAPLGCFIVWRRMAYFGDATAHAAVLGVALSLTLETPIFAGVLVVSLVMAMLVYATAPRVLSVPLCHWRLSRACEDALLDDRKFLGPIAVDLDFKAVRGSGLLLGVRVDQLVAGANRMLDDDRLGVGIDVADGEGLGLGHGRLGGQHAAAVVDLGL